MPSEKQIAELAQILGRPEPRLPPTPPDIVGAVSNAWRCDVDETKRRHQNPNGCTVAAWIVHAPWAHPLWHSYFVTMISLADREGVPAARLYLPGATHEIMVIALNPDHPLNIVDRPHYLTPFNFLGQFKAESDAAATERVERDVRDICDGRLNPDTDAISQWVARYGDYGVRPEYRRSVQGSQPVGHA